MSKKILIFKPDKIGDLIVSCPPILTIKEYLKDSNLTLVASNKNFDYAKSLNLFNEILLFPDTGIFNKIKFIVKLRKKKFDCIYIFDGKEKSLISTFFLKSSLKVGISNEIKKYFNLLNIKIFEFNNNKLYDVFQKILHYSKIDKEINHYDFISKKKNNNILITTGFINFPLLDEIKKKFLSKLKDNIYLNNEMSHPIYFVDRPSFFDIESLMTKTKLLIVCHGSLTHVANSFNIKIVDIIQESKKEFYFTYTYYISNYNFLFRSSFHKLEKMLINFMKVEK